MVQSGRIDGKIREGEEEMDREKKRVVCSVCKKEKVEWREGKCVICYREEHKKGNKVNEYEGLEMKITCPLRFREMLRKILNGEKSQKEYVKEMGVSRQRISYIFKQYTQKKRG